MAKDLVEAARSLVELCASWCFLALKWGGKRELICTFVLIGLDAVCLLVDGPKDLAKSGSATGLLRSG